MTGGKREGAGRKPLPKNIKKVGVLIKLPPDLITWMDDQTESRPVLIEKAMREKYEIDPKRT